MKSDFLEDTHPFGKDKAFGRSMVRKITNSSTIVDEVVIFFKDYILYFLVKIKIY